MSEILHVDRKKQQMQKQKQKQIEAAETDVKIMRLRRQDNFKAFEVTQTTIIKVNSS